MLREVREETLPLLPDLGVRAARWAHALDPAEAAELVRDGRADELADRLRARLMDARGGASMTTGIVYLVGAGPGDPKLITVRGTEVLGLADVVVYDRLAPPALLDLAPTNAERLYVGKEPGRPAMPQPDIDALLVGHARRGRTVVRLKGGDPFVFGRGGEEALACASRRGAVRDRAGRVERDRGAGARGHPRHASRRGAELRGRDREHRAR